METVLQEHIARTLSPKLSHILIEIQERRPVIDPRKLLADEGIAVERETILRDKQGREWLVLSVPTPKVNRLVLEFIERGVGSNIQGVNASTVRETA